MDKFYYLLSLDVVLLKWMSQLTVNFFMLKCVWMLRIGKTHLVELLIVIGALVVLEPAVLTLVMVSLCLNVGLVFFYV